MRIGVGNEGAELAAGLSLGPTGTKFFFLPTWDSSPVNLPLSASSFHPGAPFTGVFILSVSQPCGVGESLQGLERHRTEPALEKTTLGVSPSGTGI